MEKIIKIEGTIFEILVKVHNMKHVKDNIYIDPVDKKWHLTPYGFVSNVQYAEGVKATMQNKTIREHKKIIRELNNTLSKKNKKIKELNEKLNNSTSLA